MGEVIDMRSSSIVINRVIDGLIDRIEAGNMIASVYQNKEKEFELNFDGVAKFDDITEDALGAAVMLGYVFKTDLKIQEAVVDYCVAVGAFDTALNA